MMVVSVFGAVVLLLFGQGCLPDGEDVKDVIHITVSGNLCRGCTPCEPEEGEGEAPREGEYGEGEGETFVEGEMEGEPARSLTGAWVCGEDTEFAYSFCEDGTFTFYTVYYWGKCRPPEICREMTGCGTYTTGEDASSPTIDLQFTSGDRCVVLGRYQWVSEGQVQLYLNVGVCGGPRPDSPYYYSMRSGGPFDCVCAEEGEGEAPAEGENGEGEGETFVEGEMEGEPARSLTGAWVCGEDTEFAYSFCEDGTFTLYTVYYWGKCQPPEICREMTGCGTYTTNEDASSPTIDLQFTSGDRCVVLGRYQWVSEGQAQLYLNVGVCGGPRPDSPYYYPMRSGGPFDCVCAEEREGEAPGEGEA